MYECETAGVMVRVEPRFLPEESDPDGGRWLWAYAVEIENRSPETVQLLTRFWQITDANGLTQEVRGPGVVGQQPVIPPGQTFRYSSGCPLNAPSGMMVGAYSMLRTRDGHAFDIAIPAFALDSPQANTRAN